ncbi:MAG: cache domain-containing protein, partial [Desulfobaccales bacterium]
MRRFPFLITRHALALLLALNVALLGISIYLGIMSARQMQDIVKEDFNQQQLVLARHTASLLEQDVNFLKRELNTLNYSPAVQYLEPLTWANRMRATLASVREEGVVAVIRIDAKDRQAYLVAGRGLDRIASGSFKDAPYLDWAGNPENRDRVYVSPVSTQVADYAGRLISVMAVPTYEVSVDEDHPHPSGVFAGVLVFYIDAQRLADKFTRQIRSGKTGYAWVMDSQGTFLSHPERDFVGKNAFTVRKQRAPAISFDAINRIQKEKMLKGQEGWGTYISGWHRGLTGEIRKLIAYAPVRLADPASGPTANPAPIWAVA